VLDTGVQYLSCTLGLSKGRAHPGTWGTGAKSAKWHLDGGRDLHSPVLLW